MFVDGLINAGASLVLVGLLLGTLPDLINLLITAGESFVALFCCLLSLVSLVVAGPSPKFSAGDRVVAGLVFEPPLSLVLGVPLYILRRFVLILICSAEAGLNEKLAPIAINALQAIDCFLFTIRT